jgi:tRNA1Val (adenine37-N6)-methyltransferase
MPRSSLADGEAAAVRPETGGELAPPVAAGRSAPSPAEDPHTTTDTLLRGRSAPSPAEDPHTTTDTLLRGRVTLFQPRRGFRSSLDPVLLASFLAPPLGRFVDIGCGTGALTFLLMAADPAAQGVGVELQPRLARLAAAGRDHNQLAGRLEIVEGDIRRLTARLGAARFDLVATNPPFRPVARGVSSPDEERALANHEVALSLAEWLAAAAELVRPGGRVGVIYPAERLGELLSGMSARDLQPARLRAVHSYADRPARRVLLEAHRASRRPLCIEPPLIVHAAAGHRFTPEVERMLGEGAAESGSRQVSVED